MARDEILYRTWLNMKQRCYNPNASGYKHYGARGITVCERWLQSFTDFANDMGTRPDGHSIDRIDTDKGYSPDNCKWSTQKEQLANRNSFNPNPNRKYAYGERLVKAERTQRYRLMKRLAVAMKGHNENVPEKVSVILAAYK